MEAGIKIYNLAKQLWGVNRSITGEGVRQTLDVISEHIPKLMKQVASHLNDISITEEHFNIIIT